MNNRPLVAIIFSLLAATVCQAQCIDGLCPINRPAYPQIIHDQTPRLTPPPIYFHQPSFSQPQPQPPIQDPTGGEIFGWGWGGNGNGNGNNNVPKLTEEQTPSARAAVRVVVGDSCGSGSVCGRYKTGSLILTNAHVAGTRVGKVCEIYAVVDGRTQRLKAQVIMAAYSDKTLTDWAVLYAPDWQEIEPVKLSTLKPTGNHYTRGSPRCVWPQVTTAIVTAEVADQSPLWRWRPNSIGGQSGSGVWSQLDHLQYGLLTWSWGGLGAGQQTHQIHKQAIHQTTDGPPRIPGLTVPDRTIVPSGTRAEKASVVVEVGFFQETGITDLPIWDDGTEPQPQPGNDGCLSADDQDRFERFQKIAAARGLDQTVVLERIIEALGAVK